MHSFITSILFFITITSFGQNADFEIVIQNATTPIKDQEETGSCWAFAACSFFESELLKTNTIEYNLSEAFLIYYSYLDKAQNYFLRQSKTNFATGGLSHDAVDIIKKRGIIPNKFFKGDYIKDGVTDYFEMHDILEASLNTILKIKSPSEQWLQHYEDILISYLGEIPKTFNINGKTINSIRFVEDIGLTQNEYLSFTSFTHHPFYSNFILKYLIITQMENFIIYLLINLLKFLIQC